MPTEGRAEDVSLVTADCTISGDGGMLVLQAAEPDKFPVPPGEATSNVTIRLCAIVGVAMLIAGGLVWLPGMTRPSRNFATQSDETPRQVAKNVAKDEVRSTTEVKSPAAENDLAATIGKPIATAPSLPAPEVASTGAPTPMQVAKSVGKVEVRSATEVKSRAENDLAATTEKPIAAAASLPAAEIAPTGGTPKPTSQSADAPVASGPVPGPAPPSGGARQLDNNEIAMLVRRGKDFLKVGDLATSRLLLQRAATAGSAEATFILGTTFDPQFMRRMGVVGVEPDIARAREWYKRAAELGSTEASQQLATLQREGTRKQP